MKYYTARIPKGSLRYPISFLKQLPIKQIDCSQQEQIIDLVNRILTHTEDNNYLNNHTKQVKVYKYEKQIDQLVYKLYGLTSEEIEVIENSIKK